MQAKGPDLEYNSPKVVLRQRSFPRTYEVHKRIAVGGMGEVYEGFARDIERRVAIKRMLKSDSSPDLAELFLREVAVCATLEHPNVVEVIDAGPLEADLYLVMEYVDGPALAEVLEALGRQGQRLPVEITCGIMAQVARGLAHAHERALPDGTSLGIVHRDVAAENVLITRTGLPKLVDFGLATLSGHSFTTPGTIRGRPRALSPEQARGERIDVRSDIFAMGAMMFELASGVQLYPHEALAKMLWKVTAGDYDPIAPRLEGVDPDLVEIIQTAIEIDPRNRFRSAREMERALDAFRAARGMRIDSGRIAAVITKLWPEVQQIRVESAEEGPGELEGKHLVIAADRLDTTTANLQVPEFVANANKAATGPHGPAARPQRTMSSATPSKARPGSTTYGEETALNASMFPKPSEGGQYASYPSQTQEKPRPPSFPPARRPEDALSSLAAMNDSSTSLRAGLRAALDEADSEPYAVLSADSAARAPARLGPAVLEGSSIPKPATPARTTRAAFRALTAGGERAWMLFLGVVLFIALVTFVLVWLGQPNAPASASAAAVDRTASQPISPD
jgi:serine/threonine protein kinase